MGFSTTLNAGFSWEIFGFPVEDKTKIVKSKATKAAKFQEYSDFALKTVAQSQEDIKNGDFHSFDNVDDAIEFLKRL